LATLNVLLRAFSEIDFDPTAELAKRVFERENSFVLCLIHHSVQAKQSPQDRPDPSPGSSWHRRAPAKCIAARDLRTTSARSHRPAPARRRTRADGAADEPFAGPTNRRLPESSVLLGTTSCRSMIARALWDADIFPHSRKAPSLLLLFLQEIISDGRSFSAGILGRGCRANEITAR
jgi:hypothetical protein